MSKRDEKKPPQKPTKSKKKERSTKKDAPKDDGSKWQEFLRRHSKVQENNNP